MACFLFGSGSSSTRAEMCWGWKPSVEIYVSDSNTKPCVRRFNTHTQGSSKDLNMFLSSFRSSSSRNDAGFLQKNNSLEEKSRMVGSFREKEQSHNRENREKESRFTHTETDFSNLFARGKTSNITAPSLVT